MKSEVGPTIERFEQGQARSLVAIVTRTRNRPNLLERVLHSILSQFQTNFVWVIVNDGGEQAPIENICSKARQSGIKTSVIHYAKSVGMESASNAGIRSVSSDYLVIHDDDDSWEPGFLDATTKFLGSHPEFVGVITHTTAIHERQKENKIGELWREPYVFQPRAVYLADLARINAFPPIAFLYRRSLFEKLGGYDESMPVLGDWDFNLRALMIGDIGVIPKALANYHQRLEGAAPDYANTITAKRDLHHAMEAQYRNRLLREDLKSGKMGLGTLLALGRLQSRASLHRPNRPLGSLLGWLRRSRGGAD